MNENSPIVADFQRFFSVIAASNQALKEETYRIRYRVYAAELGWEDKALFPTGQERDAYDDYAQACLLQHRPSKQFVGCVRLVSCGTDPTRPFPFEAAMKKVGQRLDSSSWNADWRASAGEISRVAVVAQFRRRRNERNHPDNPPDEEPSLVEPERRVFPHIAVGLYLAAAAMGLTRGVERVFAIMEPRLARRLRSYGIEFEAVGEPLEHHGLRVPYCVTRDGFERNVATPIRGLLDTIVQDLMRSA